MVILHYHHKVLKVLRHILQDLDYFQQIMSNGLAVKFAAKLLGLCDDNVRLPLVKVTETTKEIVKKALESAKLV